MSNGYLFGVGALLLFWIMSYWVSKPHKIEPWALAISKGTGENHKPVLSASKFQVLLWSLVVLFAYSSVFGARFFDDPTEVLKALPMIPINLLLLMGFSVTTAVGSKSVTIDYKTKGLVGSESGGLISDPKGQGNLVKTQMLAWTIMGAIIYLMSVVSYISAKQYSHLDVAALPDLDSTLLLLMGVSKGSYLGNKIVTKDVVKVPKISEILPLKGPKKTLVTILGENFGEPQEESFVTMQGSIIRQVGFWNDKQIRVELLDNFQKGDKIDLGVYCSNNSSNKITFEVT